MCHLQKIYFNYHDLSAVAVVRITCNIQLHLISKLTRINDDLPEGLKQFIEEY
jgi:hypothetical protein